MTYERLEHKEYVKLAERTLSYGFFLQDFQQVLFHGVIGLVTELQELMIAIHKIDSEEKFVNIGEEVTDCLWYMAIFERELNIDLSNYQTRLFKIKPQDAVFELLKDGIELLDLFKKNIYYNKPLDLEKFAKLVYSINSVLNCYAEGAGYDVAVLRARNINKLMIRYPEKFTEENAINRNLNAEYEALKGK